MAEYQALIVEDDAALGSIFAEVFDSCGLQTTVVKDGRLALTWLEDAVPDLILLDLHLPHISGLEILDNIRANSRLKTAVVAVVTADAMRSREASKKADLVLTKPVSLNQLLQLAEWFNEGRD